MQSKSLVFLFIVVVTIPIIALSTNHEIFFGVVALIIMVLSIRYIYRLITGETFQITEVDEELEEELEELMDIDVKRFGTGLSIVYHLLVILFLCYCALFMETIVLKSIAAFAILLQIHFISYCSHPHCCKK